MSFPIDTTIPAAGNNPSSDQPRMLQNNVNINGWTTVDHVVGGAAQNGIHLQSSYLNRAIPVTLTNSINSNPSNGIAYVNNATIAGSTFVNDYYYYNGPGVNQSNYPLNCTRAYGLFTGGVLPVLLNGFNITGVNRVSTGIYNISFSQPASGTNYGVQLTAIRASNTFTTAVISSVLIQNPTAITVIFIAVNINSNIVLVDPDRFTVTILGA